MNHSRMNIYLKSIQKGMHTLLHTLCIVQHLCCYNSQLDIEWELLGLQLDRRIQLDSSSNLFDYHRERIYQLGKRLLRQQEVLNNSDLVGIHCNKFFKSMVGRYLVGIIPEHQLLDWDRSSQQHKQYKMFKQIEQMFHLDK